jgi:hypothetical protein
MVIKNTTGLIRIAAEYGGVKRDIKGVKGSFLLFGVLIAQYRNN